MSASLPSIQTNATVLDYAAEPDGKTLVLRKGTNGWMY